MTQNFHLAAIPSIPELTSTPTSLQLPLALANVRVIKSMTSKSSDYLYVASHDA